MKIQKKIIFSFALILCSSSFLSSCNGGRNSKVIYFSPFTDSRFLNTDKYTRFSLNLQHPELTGNQEP
jgi:ABC-type oligopeptide transport system substrate-binding subunit